MRAPRNFTPDEDAALRHVYDTAGDVKALAAELNRSVSSVKNRASYLGLIYRLPAAPAEPVDLRPWAEIEMARLMGNKRFEDVRLKGERA